MSLQKYYDICIVNSQRREICCGWAERRLRESSRAKLIDERNLYTERSLSSKQLGNQKKKETENKGTLCYKRE